MTAPPELLEFDPSSIAEVASLLSLSPSESAMLAPDHPFLRYGEWRGFATLSEGVLDARVVASIDPRQQTSRSSIGCLGFINLGDGPTDGGGTKGGENALAAAIAWLRERQVDVVRGPVEFSTWYGHRAVTDAFPNSGGPPAFPLEPRYGRPVVDLLGLCGFLPAHRAISFSVDSRAVIDSSTPAFARLRKAGLRGRPLCPERLEDELRLVHELSTDMFRGSWGFSEISLDEFDTMYRPLVPFLDTDLVQILETSDGTAVGFAFAIAVDPRKGAGAGFVVKTLGVVDDARRRFPGAGAGLTALIHEVALERGYARGIHALMAQGSMAHRLSSRWGGRPLRAYATFERAID